MSEKINVLGIKIDNIEVAEAIEKTQAFLNTESLSTIEVLTTRMLVKAGEDEVYKEILEQLDMSVIGDKKILQAAEIEDHRRHKEVEDNGYMKMLLQYADENEKLFVLICETPEEQEALENYFAKKVAGAKVAAAFVTNQMHEDADSLVNRINGASPEIILSTMKIPDQELFLKENRAKLHASVWLGVGKTLQTSGFLESKGGFLGKMIENRIFKKKIMEYQQEKGDS